MKQDKDWTDVMRNALRDAELPPPEHGWARLEAELRGVRPEASAGMAGTEGGRTTAARRQQWKIHVKRIAAAAAVVLLGVATVGFWLRSDRMVPSTDELLAEILSVPGTASDALPEGHAGEDPEETLRSRVAQAVSLPAGPSEAAGAQRNAAAQRTAGDAAEPRLALAAVKPQTAGTRPTVDASQADAAARESQPVPVASAAGRQAPAGETRAKQAPAKPRTEQGSARTSFDGLYDQPETRRAARRRSSLSFSAGSSVAGGSGIGSGSKAPMHAMQQAPSMPGMSSAIGNSAEMTLLKSYDYDESSFRHHQPLSFALTFRKEFAYGLSLESGINYTLLQSDVRALYADKETDQTLHFVGIPVRVNWQFLERGRFSLYLGAGGMAEKCVSAKFGSKSVSEPGLQWSLIGAAGAQYRLGGMVGLYFEPEAAYYLTETRLQTARTDNPLSLTLRLGVRLSF